MSTVPPVRWGLTTSPSAAAALWLVRIRFLLVLDGAHRGADEDRLMELRAMLDGQVGEEACGPRPAVAVVLDQFGVDGQGRRLGDGHQQFLVDAAGQVVFVQDALQAILFGAFILPLRAIRWILSAGEGGMTALRRNQGSPAQGGSWRGRPPAARRWVRWCLWPVCGLAARNAAHERRAPGRHALWQCDARHGQRSELFCDGQAYARSPEQPAMRRPLSRLVLPARERTTRSAT